MDNKRIESIIIRIKKSKAIGVALLILMLCFGLMDNLVTVINNTLIHVTAFSRDIWLDWLFIIITLGFAFVLWKSWIKKDKIIAPKTVALILVPTILYGYFRVIKNSPYAYTAYWDGPVAYIDGIGFIGLVIIVLFVIQIFKKPKNQEIDNKYSFGTDVPIKQSDDDLFNMGNLVKRIVNYIAFTDVSEAAFSMGLVGEWGDGKTSLMNLVEERIRIEHKDFIIVRFNPRSSKKADYIQEDFLDSLKQSLAPHHTGIEQTIDKYAVALDVIPGVPPIISKGLEVLQIRSDKEKEIKRSELKKAILDINRRIVVLVDDLDRLTGEELIEVMKVLDTNGAFPKMVFITSFDKDYVNSVLNNYLGLGNQPRAYTDKYFTVEIRVPVHPSFRLMDYLVQLLKEAVDSGFIKTSAATIDTQTRKMASFIMSRLYTIRDVKRFANQFLYDYAEVQRDVCYRDYFLLELIKFAYPDDYEAIYRLKYIHKGQSSFLTPSSEDLLYLNDTLLPKTNKAGEHIEEPEIKPLSIDILKELFPEESNYQNWYAGRYQRIYSSSSFEHYFYNYEYSHLRSDDIDRIFNEKNIVDVCKLIDDWADFSKDLETYLLTRDIHSIKNKNVLRRFMQVLLYSAHKHQSINYWGQNYSFLRKEDVNKIIKNCGFASIQEYLRWFKDSMAELSAIDPIIPSNYLRTPIGATYSENFDTNLFIISQEELQDYAQVLLTDYLNKIGTDGWDVSTAYYMAQIQCDASGSLLPAASKALHNALVNHFDVFSASLPMFSEEYDRVHAGYTFKLRFKSVFEDKEEFESLINSEQNDKAPEIEMIRAIWPIFKANGYSNFVLPKGETIESAKKTLLKNTLQELKRYEVVDGQMNDLANEWKLGHKLANVDSFIVRAQILIKELKTIPLELTLAETYEIQLQDMINIFQEYKMTARDFNKDNLRVGYFVRMKDVVYEKNMAEHPENMIYQENIFTIGNISESGRIMTRESNLPLSYADIEAILIDGKEDSMIYFEPRKVMATYVEPGEQPPAHKTDYSYFMDRFKRCFDVNEVSYYDIVEKRGFQFVHEVQHWLKDEMQDEGLEVNHSIREELKLK